MVNIMDSFFFEKKSFGQAYFRAGITKKRSGDFKHYLRNLNSILSLSRKYDTVRAISCIERRITNAENYEVALDVFYRWHDDYGTWHYDVY